MRRTALGVHKSFFLGLRKQYEPRLKLLSVLRNVPSGREREITVLEESLPAERRTGAFLCRLVFLLISGNEH